MSSVVSEVAEGNENSEVEEGPHDIEDLEPASISISAPGG
jgi:hypothetical protein